MSKTLQSINKADFLIVRTFQKLTKNNIIINNNANAYHHHHHSLFIPSMYMK